MFCSQCGKQLDNSAVFCTFCGARTNNTAGAPAPVSEPVSAQVSAAADNAEAAVNNTVTDTVSTEPSPVSEPAAVQPAPAESANTSAPAANNLDAAKFFDDAPTPAPSSVPVQTTVPLAPVPEEKEPKYYTFGHIALCLAAVAVMAIVAGVFAGLYFSVI